MNIYDLLESDWENHLINIGEKKYRAKQIFHGLYVDKVNQFTEISTLSKDLILKITNDFSQNTLTLVEKQESFDDTKKYLFRLFDSHLIETVLMHHDYGYSLCVSTQVGCNMNCLFCASGLNKKVRDLEVSEMVLQVINVAKEANVRISSVVIMGIGEPFDNYDNVIKFIKIINANNGLAIGARHITISTCGIIPKIYRFMEEDFQVNLAISLHAPNDLIRNDLMPINHKYPVSNLMQAIKDYIGETNRRVTIEYILLKDINDKQENALELIKLLRGYNVYVNLILYNNVSGKNLKRSENVDKFYDILKKGKLNVTKRREQGLDIDAACGQLRSKRSS